MRVLSKISGAMYLRVPTLNQRVILTSHRFDHGKWPFFLVAFGDVIFSLIFVFVVHHIIEPSSSSSDLTLSNFVQQFLLFSLNLCQPRVWRNVQGIIFVPVAHCETKICYHCCPVVPVMMMMMMMMMNMMMMMTMHYLTRIFLDLMSR